MGCCKNGNDAKTVPRIMKVMSLNVLLLLQVKTGKLLSENGTAIVLDEFRVQDIDTDTDWALAEMKYKLLHMS